MRYRKSSRLSPGLIKTKNGLSGGMGLSPRTPTKNEICPKLIWLAFKPPPECVYSTLTEFLSLDRVLLQFRYSQVVYKTFYLRKMSLNTLFLLKYLPKQNGGLLFTKQREKNDEEALFPSSYVHDVRTLLYQSASSLPRVCSKL